LDDARSNSSTAAPGSTERLIGDYYGSCLNEEAINKRGIKPLTSDLELIDSIKSPPDLQNVIVHLQQEAISVPFGFRSTRTNTIRRK
jgi:putative endopeptidase